MRVWKPIQRFVKKNENGSQNRGRLKRKDGILEGWKGGREGGREEWAV